MIEILSHGKSPSEAKAKCLVTETLLTNEDISVNTVTYILSIIGIGVRECEEDTEEEYGRYWVSS